MPTQPQQPTPGAMRAAKRWWRDSAMHPTSSDLARIIDEETHVPELVAACKDAARTMRAHGRTNMEYLTCSVKNSVDRCEFLIAATSK